MSQPDRTSLPIRREAFAGVANRTLEGSQPDWNLIGHPTPPEGAPNVLLVLIDDAGFGNPGTFGGPIQTPNYTRMAEGGLRYNRFHVTALCSPTRAALLTGQEQSRRRIRLGRRVRWRVPGLLRDTSTGLRAAAADPSGQRVQHGRVRQVASHTGRAARAGGSVRPLAQRLGVRLLLRDPRRRVEPVGPLPRGEPEDHRHARRVLRRGGPRTTSRRRWPTGRSSGSMGCAHRMLTSPSSSTTRPAAATLRTMWRMNGPTSTRASSTRDGTSYARRSSPVRRGSESFRRRGAHPSQRGDPGVGRRARQAETLLRPTDGGVRGVLR